MTAALQSLTDNTQEMEEMKKVMRDLVITKEDAAYTNLKVDKLQEAAALVEENQDIKGAAKVLMRKGRVAASDAASTTAGGPQGPWLGIGKADFMRSGSRRWKEQVKKRTNIHSHHVHEKGQGGGKRFHGGKRAQAASSGHHHESSSSSSVAFWSQSTRDTPGSTYSTLCSIFTGVSQR